MFKAISMLYSLKEERLQCVGNKCRLHLPHKAYVTLLKREVSVDQFLKYRTLKIMLRNKGYETRLNWVTKQGSMKFCRNLEKFIQLENEQAGELIKKKRINKN